MNGRSDAENLTRLGSGHTDYKREGPAPDMLEVFPNPQPDQNYMVNHETEEFTSLCPKTGQPDFARVRISFVPDQSCVESKSLKLYLGSFRNEGAFMERITNTIANDLCTVMSPRWLAVTMVFKSRGGVETSVSTARGSPHHTKMSFKDATEMEVEVKKQKDYMKTVMEDVMENIARDDDIGKSARNEL